MNNTVNTHEVNVPEVSERAIRILKILWYALAICVCTILTITFFRFLKVMELEQHALSEGIFVYYVDSEVFFFHPVVCKEKGAAGLYRRTNDKEEIFVDKEYRFDPVVIAHELGHRYAIMYYNDFSEPAAWDIAYKLLDEGLACLKIFDEMEVYSK